MSILTVYPAAGNTTYFDGMYNSGYNALFTTSHGLSSAADGSDGATGTAHVIRSLYNPPSGYYISRALYLFDTSALGGGATISAVTFNIKGTGAFSNADSSSIGVVETNPASISSIADADYGTFSYTDYGSITLASWSTSAYNTISLNASGISAISKTGTTKFGLLSSNDRTDTSPSGDNLVQALSADNSGTSNDPYLEITYTVNITFIPNLLTLGVG